MKIDELLKLAAEMKASDLHLKVENHPYVRSEGELKPLDQFPRVSSEIMLGMAFSMMNNRQKQKFKESTDLDMAYGVSGLGRFRVNVFQQRGNIGMSIRLIPTKVKTIEELELPKIVDKLAQEQRGMGPGHRHDRQRQEHHSGRPDRPDQRHAHRSRHHH